jgi:hypothetical protein
MIDLTHTTMNEEKKNIDIKHWDLINNDEPGYHKV